jgi:hypothetical protein
MLAMERIKAVLDGKEFVPSDRNVPHEILDAQ